jgi:hypothetical protein
VSGFEKPNLLAHPEPAPPWGLRGLAGLYLFFTCWLACTCSASTMLMTCANAYETCYHTPTMTNIPFPRHGDWWHWPCPGPMMNPGVYTPGPRPCGTLTLGYLHSWPGTGAMHRWQVIALVLVLLQGPLLNGLLISPAKDSPAWSLAGHHQIHECSSCPRHSD